MADLVVLAGVAGFFTIAWAFVRGCDRIIGPDDPSLAVDPPQSASAETIDTRPEAVR